jgi:polysaccharide export outer membrane protein
LSQRALSNLIRFGWCAALFSITLAVAQTPSYVLGPGDEISINVFGEEDLSMDVRISDTGRLNYPFLGELQVGGMNVAELEDTITSGLKGDYLISPVVTVSISEYRPFFVHGQVKEPGGIPYQPGLTVSRAVALAGGFTERAARNKIEVIRATDATKTPVTIDLGEPVYAGDVITVNQSFF